MAWRFRDPRDGMCVVVRWRDNARTTHNARMSNGRRWRYSPIVAPTGDGLGAGAVIPIEREDLSMGMSRNESMWVSLSSDKEARSRGASSFEAQLTPWWGPPSNTYRNNEIVLGMGYDILRLQGMKSILVADGRNGGDGLLPEGHSPGPISTWFWGMVHFDDGSYLDWFMRT